MPAAEEGALHGVEELVQQPPEVTQDKRRRRLARLQREIAQAARQYQGSPPWDRSRGASEMSRDGSGTAGRL